MFLSPVAQALTQFSVGCQGRGGQDSVCASLCKSRVILRTLQFEHLCLSGQPCESIRAPVEASAALEMEAVGGPAGSRRGEPGLPAWGTWCLGGGLSNQSSLIASALHIYSSQRGSVQPPAPSSF